MADLSTSMRALIWKSNSNVSEKQLHNQHHSPPLIQLSHLHRLGECVTALVHILGQQHLIVGVDACLKSFQINI